MRLPDGYGVEFPIGGLDRPDHIVENIEEVELRFQDAVQPSMECAYCGDRLRTRSKAEAERWWLTHDCEKLLLQEQVAIVHDLAARGLGFDPPESLAA